MKAIIIIACVLLCGCGFQTNTVSVTDVENQIVSMENVYEMDISYAPHWSHRGAWRVTVTIKHPTCGKINIDENGNDLDKVFVVIKERASCLNTCK